ncbi:2-methylisocitrate lyase-like PEP mutase family enzyme [Stackebrandtia endophytica]|uniref:2-methylisocitrate lyase-like PEP mutase family enzyme n=1 Tax=Stackebrandtia endophytica TaxID=1496996 RepID=A0A543APS9_9ACTN|nr:isocitrate lyase/phosphoenolpyruvate mutase family protein [Stackebrandtia endophytica]TQL74584.1 2-methylisocitrate lyase-like PEP mutase family enzyme [Stackebrandtia endophytica]
MTYSTHVFDRFADVRVVLADPALAPQLPAGDRGKVGASVAWLRETVARFSFGEDHRRRRAMVAADLAKLEPATLRRLAMSSDGEVQLRVVSTLAAALGIPEPDAVAEAITVIAETYFGGNDAAADERVAWLVSHVEPREADLEVTANRIGLLVQACTATAALVEAASDSDTPLARILHESPPVSDMRRIAIRATRVAGRDIREGDVVLLDLVTAQRGHPELLTFGAPQRICPGRAQAVAVAEGLLERPRTAFADLHHQTSPLLLPNAWDHASAVALVAQGFPVIATTSLGVAAAMGVSDGAAETMEATLMLARRLGQSSIMFTIDAEGGFSDDPMEVAELARKLHDAGAVGINLEDGRGDGTLSSVEQHAAKISAVKAAAPSLFVNARTDTYWLMRQWDETAQRLAAYEQAGADGVFVPALSDPDQIAALSATVITPLNILYSPTGPTIAELAALGVRRVSLGSLLYRSAVTGAVNIATAIRDGKSPELAALSYAEIQGLADGATKPRT